MRFAIPLAAIVATGCGDTGAAISITAPSSTRVEVFIAASKVYDDQGQTYMGGVGWDAMVTVPPPGYVFLLPDDRRLEATRTGDTFEVQLQAEPGYHNPIAIAIAGYDANDRVVEAAVLRSVEIPINSAETWRVELAQVDAANQDLGAPSETPRAIAWRRPNDPNDAEWPSCFAYQYNTREGWQTDYFVPPGDPDCDAQAPECKDYWANYAGGSGDAWCLTTTGTDLSGTCTLGRTVCADGVQPGTCTQRSNTVCLPTALCTTCAGRPVAECVGGQAGMTLPPDMPVAKCDFEMLTNQWCAPMGGFRIPGRGDQCVSARIHVPGDPFSSGSSDQVFSFGVHIGVMVKPVLTAASPCEVFVSILEGPTTPFTGFQEHALLSVTYDSGRTLVVPFALGFEMQQCSTIAAPCRLLGGDADAVYACAGP